MPTWKADASCANSTNAKRVTLLGSPHTRQSTTLLPSRRDSKNSASVASVTCAPQSEAAWQRQCAVWLYSAVEYARGPAH